MPLSTKGAMEGLLRIVMRAPFTIAPERAERLASEIFGSSNWTVRPSNLEANFYAVPQEFAIYLSHAGMASLWCLTYASFHMMEAAGLAQRTQRNANTSPIEVAIRADLLLHDHIAFARALMHRDQLWPDNLARPAVDALLSTAEGRINNTFFGALSWIMLHEIAHVHHSDVKHAPHFQRVNQEYAADDFATRWILDESGAGLANEFRILVICVALSWLFLQEREKGRSPTHPSAFNRLREVVKYFNASKRSVGLENAAYVFKALLDPTTPAPAVDSPQEMFDWMQSRLKILFPP